MPESQEPVVTQSKSSFWKWSFCFCALSSSAWIFSAEEEEETMDSSALWLVWLVDREVEELDEEGGLAAEAAVETAAD